MNNLRAFTHSLLGISFFCWAFLLPFDTHAVIASVDNFTLTVYYTEAVAGVAPFFSWWSLPLMLLGCAWVLWKEGYLGGDIVHE